MVINCTTDLRLSNRNFHQTIEESIGLCVRDERWLSKPIFPLDDTLAVLAQLAYKDDLPTTIFSSTKTFDQLALNSFEEDVKGSLRQIRDEWKLLTTARNKNDGYFGAAFWNSTEQQLVISHRGTKPKDLNVLLTDIEGIIKNRHTSQIDSACTFVAHVLQQLPAKPCIQISITGHSLGAWLAQITAFCSEYLTLDRETNKFRVKSEEDIAYHVHCVGFESPGCRRMLTKLSEVYHHRYQHPDYHFWTNLDISLYFTRPNMVNTFSKHVGKLYQMDIAPLDRNSYNPARYVLHYHSMNNIVLAFTNGTAAIKEIRDWPLVSLPEKTKNDDFQPPNSSSLISTVSQFIGSLPGLLYNYIAASKQEVESYFQSHENDTVFENTIYGIKLHYAIADVDASTCNSNVFSQTENMFLMCCQCVNSVNLKDDNDIIIKEISNCLPNIDFNPFRSLLKSIVYDNEGRNQRQVIECNPEFRVETIVNFTKQLFRFFDTNNNAKRFVQNLAQNSRANILIVNGFSRSYTRRISGVDCLQFCDTIGLVDFFACEEQKMFVIKTRFKFELQRIYSTVRVQDKLKYIFLDAAQLTHLNNCLHLTPTLSSMSADHVLVLDYQIESLDEREIGKVEELLDSVKMLKVILVVQSELAENSIKKLNNNCMKFLVHDGNLYLSDLKADSRTHLTNLVQHKHLMLHGRQVELLSFFPNKQLFFEALDSNIVAELIKEENEIPLEIGGPPPAKLCQAEAAYMNRVKLMETENLIKAFRSNSNDMFLIFCGFEGSHSSCLDAFIGLLKIRKEDEKEIIKINTKIIMEGLNFDINDCLRINVFQGDRDSNENRFRDICCLNPNKIVYCLEMVHEQLLLFRVYNPHFYIKRHLLYYRGKAIIRNNISPLFLKEHFVFSQSDEAAIYKLLNIDSEIEGYSIMKRHIFASFNEGEVRNKFNDWCCTVKDSPVHWLKVEDKKLVWQKSHFSYSELRQYFEDNDKCEIDEEALANVNNKVVIVVAEPGMGKSTTLTHLSEFKLGDSWVIRLNLKDYQSDILSLHDDFNNTDETMECVINFLSKVSNFNLHKPFALQLLKYCLRYQTSQLLLVLFDGYDEIDQVCQKKLMALMNYLKEQTFAHLWITSREHCTQDLEMNLGVLSTTFKKLSFNEREYFLVNFWSSCLKLDFQVLFNKFRVFADALLGKADDFLNETVAAFMGIPLQLRLLAEGFLPELEKFLQSNVAAVPFFEKLNVSGVYQRFIKFKVNLYFQVKTNLSLGVNNNSKEWLSREIYRLHQRLAMCLLFANKKINAGIAKIVVNISISRSLLNNTETAINPNDELELKRLGILQSCNTSSGGGGEIEFVHRTFAEYFAAGYILNRLRKNNYHRMMMRDDGLQQLLVIVLQEYPVICNFLNEQITEHDVASIKSGHFTCSDIISTLCNELFDRPELVNLTKLILSFFKNKLWLLNQDDLNQWLYITLTHASQDLLDFLLTLTLNNYTAVHKMLYISHYHFHSDSLIYHLDVSKINNVKLELAFTSNKSNYHFNLIMNAIKCYPKMLQELLIINNNNMVAWREIIKDTKLCKLLREIADVEQTSVKHNLTAVDDVLLPAVNKLAAHKKYDELKDMFSSFSTKGMSTSCYFKIKGIRCFEDESILDETQEVFVVFLIEHFKNNPAVCMDLFSTLVPYHPKYIRELIDTVEGEEIKELLRYYLFTLTDANGDIITEKNLKDFATYLLKVIKTQKIATMEALFNCVDEGLVKFLVEETRINRQLQSESDLKLLLKSTDFDILTRSLRQLADYGQSSLIAAHPMFAKQMVHSLKIFPRLFHLLALKSNIRNIFSNDYFIWKDVPETSAACLAIMLSAYFNVQSKFETYESFNQMIESLFTNLKSYPTILAYLLTSIPYRKHKSCGHFAVMEYPAQTIETVLTDVKNTHLLNHVVNNFDEEDKLILFEVMQVNKPGNLLACLNGLKVKEDMFRRFILPADKSIKPAFYLAGERGYKEVMDFLLSALKRESDILWELLKWADPVSSQTVLHRACEGGYREIVEAILDSVHYEQQPENVKILFILEDTLGRTALDCAILSERQYFTRKFPLASRKKLIVNEECQMFQNNFGNEKHLGTQIIGLRKLSSKLKRMPMVVNLILIFAKAFDSVELMMSMFGNRGLKRALQAFNITFLGYSFKLLNCAIERGSLELVEQLIKKGVDVNATNSLGRTPLMRAVEYFNEDIVKALLDNGADAYATDIYGQTAFSNAKSFFRSD